MAAARILLGVTLIGNMAACSEAPAMQAPATAGTHVVVTGMVSDTDDRPLPGARVEILTDSNAIALTDANGHFSVSGVTTATGYVHLRASRRGYASATSTLTVPSSARLLQANGLRLAAGCDAPAFAC
jgi:hypothetical protein